MLKTGIAASLEAAAGLLDPSRMLKTQSYKIQRAMGLPNCLWKVGRAILSTDAGSNLIRMDEIDASWRKFKNQM